MPLLPRSEPRFPQKPQFAPLVHSYSLIFATSPSSVCIFLYVAYLRAGLVFLCLSPPVAPLWRPASMTALFGVLAGSLMPGNCAPSRGQLHLAAVAARGAEHLFASPPPPPPHWPCGRPCSALTSELLRCCAVAPPLVGWQACPPPPLSFGSLADTWFCVLGGRPLAAWLRRPCTCRWRYTTSRRMLFWGPASSLHCLYALLGVSRAQRGPALYG